MGKDREGQTGLGRITECLGVKAHPLPPPAVGGDPFRGPRLPQPRAACPGHCRAGPAAAPLESPCRALSAGPGGISARAVQGLQSRGGGEGGAAPGAGCGVIARGKPNRARGSAGTFRPLALISHPIHYTKMWLFFLYFHCVLSKTKGGSRKAPLERICFPQSSSGLEKINLETFEKI